MLWSPKSDSSTCRVYASHQQILSVEDLESQDLLREALEDVKDTLNDIITTGFGHEAEEGT